MKFGKDLRSAIESANPEWGPYWINYKFLKKLIHSIIGSSHDQRPKQPVIVSYSGNIQPPSTVLHSHEREVEEISKSNEERQFFSRLHKEVKKTNVFFNRLEIESCIRWDRIWNAYLLLREKNNISDIFDKTGGWARLLTACVNFYRDMLVVENFAILNYDGFSKILKKHDKLTGFDTRTAFMKKIVNHQKIANFPRVLNLIDQAEQLFRTIQILEKVVPLQAEEKLFIEVVMGLSNSRNSDHMSSSSQIMEISEDETESAELSQNI